MIFIALYVNYCLCVGDKGAIAILEKKIVNAGFQVKPSEELNDYLSFNIGINKKEVSAILHQGHFIKNLNNLYVKQVKGLTTYNMLGTPSVGLVRPTDKNKLVPKEDHEQYRTGAGMLLYLVKHTRPDISNAVR